MATITIKGLPNNKVCLDILTVHIAKILKQCTYRNKPYVRQVSNNYSKDLNNTINIIEL